MNKAFVNMGMSLDGFIAGPHRGPSNPLLLGEGLRLFDGPGMDRLAVDVVEAPHSPRVTHLRYVVKRR